MKPVLDSPTPSSSAKGFRVLCADDDYDVAIVLRRALEQEGYHVECSGDGLSAFSRAMETPAFFDLIITDHEMPKVSGLILVQQLRETNFPGKIVVHSSQLSDSALARYQALSVDHILTKPVSLPVLLAAVRRFVP